MALFYFSGHGLQREAGVCEGYLATSDAIPAQGHYGISLTWLRRLIEASPVPQVVILLDCCHSGEIFSFRDVNPGTQAGHSRLLIAACREYEAAYETLDSSYSVLTRALLAGLDPHRAESGQISHHSLMDWVGRQLRGEGQQPLFECSGEDMILTQVGSNLKPQTTESPKLQASGFCPYVGLAPFTETHGEYFFGRAALVQQLLERVRSQNFCAVIGASSSGKTSLLRAGLIYQLRQGQAIAGSTTWPLRYLSPGQRPLRNLAAAFVSPTADNIERAAQLNRAETLLRESDQGLAQLIAATLMPPAAGNRFWLIIDQFEELFAPCHNPQGMAERRQFVNSLLTALSDPDVPLGIVIGLRADAMDGLLAYPELLSLLEDRMLLVTSLPYEQLRAGVIQPAEKIGVQVDPLLLHHLMLDLTGAPGELALMQQTLVELWQRRGASAFWGGREQLTLAAYVDLGGVKNILTNRATTVYESLSAPEQVAAQRILLALCELGEGCEDNKRRASKTELINDAFPEALISNTLEKLVKARLVVVDQAAATGLPPTGVVWQTGQPESVELQWWWVQNGPVSATTTETIEIAHRSLIQDWHLLRQWVSEHRDRLRYQRRLELFAQEWQQRGRPRHRDDLLGGQRLREAVAFLQAHGGELSGLAQDYVGTSRRAQFYQQVRTAALTLLVPLALVAGMALSLLRHRLPPIWLGLPRPAQEQSRALPQAHRLIRLADEAVLSWEPEATAR
jgi:hypothetical protein